MRKRWNIKAKLAGGLAAAMVFTMVAPGLETFAAARARVNYGDPVKMIFDPGDGPGLEITNYRPIVSPGNYGKKIEIEGQAGYKIEDHEKLGGLTKPTPPEQSNAFWYDTKDGLGLNAPLYPKEDGSFPDNSDPGNDTDTEVSIPGWNYKFLGFYDSDGQKIKRIDPRFQYNPPYIYTSRWAVDPTKPYHYEVRYYRDLDPVRDAKPSTDEAAWPDFTKPDDNSIRKLRSNLWKTNAAGNEVPAVTNVPVTIPYESDMPGYRIKDVLIRNNISRNYYGVNLSDPGRNKGLYVDTDQKVKGYMPNDNTIVAFRYEPNQSVTYPVTIRYVDGSGNPIQAADTSRRYPVEHTEDLTPPAIDKYKITGVALTKGNGIDDLAGTGIFTAASAGSGVMGETGEGKPNQFHLVMPNQPVEITFTYSPTEAPVTNVTVSYLYQNADGKTYPIDGEKPEQLPPIADGGSLTIPLKEIGGYQYSYITAPDLVYSVSSDKQNITINFNAKSGTLAIVYVQNDDPNYWGTITFGSDGRYGNISMPAGKETIKFKKSEGITVDQATEQVQHVPNLHYQWDGWYNSVSGENKPTGSRLDGGTKLDKTTRLFGNFVEKEGEWYDITFGSGPNGKIGSSGKIHTNSTLTPNWSYLAVPAVTADKGYIFDCWVDEAGNRLLLPDPSSGYPGIEIQSSQKYTATFRPLGINPDGVPAKPNAAGSIRGDGKGQILVKGANNNRKYVLTDSEGMIKETKNGSWLAVNKFFESNKSESTLNPCTDYQVFEVLSSVPDTLLQVGGNLLEDVDPSKLSYPAIVTVPALGQYTVENDGTEGKMKITVKTADPDSQYAVLDVDGNMVNLTDSDEGWVNPAGGTAVLRGLDEKNLYTVIAKPKGETVSPEDKAPMGSQISIPNSTQLQNKYTIELVNGGFIESVNGESAGGVSSLSVHRGDVVKINAPSFDDRSFKKWNVLIGPGGFREDLQSSEITVSNSNMVLQAEYKPLSEASPSNAIAFTTNSSSVGLDMSAENQEELERVLTDNKQDQAASQQNQVTYTVNFSRRPPVASESDALRKGGYVDKTAKIPWTLRSSLTRQVGSANQPLPTDPNFNRNAPIWIYGNIDRGVQGYSSYNLWEAEPDGTFTEMTMEPDPNESPDPNGTQDPDNRDSDFTGLFRFQGRIGYTYAMSYMESYRVTIMNNKKGGSVSIAVTPDTALSDTPGYDQLDKEPILGTDGGLIWKYAGLTRKEDSPSGSFDPDTQISKNMTLYVLYDDSEWQAARKQVNGELNRAKALIDDPAINEDDKKSLQADIDLIQPAGNDQHTRSVQQLQKACQYLKDKVDAIINGNQPTPPTPPDPPTPPEPDHPGGGGGGSGGGSGGGGYTGGTSFPMNEKLPPGPAQSGVGPGYDFNNYKTYHSGSGGYWSNVGGDSSKWSFILPDGQRVANQWINVTYDDLRGTCTYHLDANGEMNSGWYIDETGKSYFLDPVQGPNYGRLTLGWYQDPSTQTWYYFDQFDGSMLTGWQKLLDRWYYLSPDMQDGHQKGTLYVSGTTPDGYQVDADGRWVEGAQRAGQ